MPMSSQKGEEKMTRKELVELLVANYGENDEVFVKYEDDQGDWVDTVKGIGDVTQTHSKGHYEVRNADGEWKRMAEGDDVWKHMRNDVRYVTDKEWEETHRCIIV